MKLPILVAAAFLTISSACPSLAQDQNPAPTNNGASWLHTFTGLAAAYGSGLGPAGALVAGATAMAASRFGAWAASWFPADNQAAQVGIPLIVNAVGAGISVPMIAAATTLEVATAPLIVIPAVVSVLTDLQSAFQSAVSPNEGWLSYATLGAVMGVLGSAAAATVTTVTLPAVGVAVLGGAAAQVANWWFNAPKGTSFWNSWWNTQPPNPGPTASADPSTATSIDPTTIASTDPNPPPNPCLAGPSDQSALADRVMPFDYSASKPKIALRPHITGVPLSSGPDHSASSTSPISSGGIVLRPSTVGHQPSTDPSHPAILPAAPNPCKPAVASAVPTSSVITLRPSSLGHQASTGPNFPANLPASANPCKPATANSSNTAVAHVSNATSAASGGIVLRSRTYGQQPSAGQASAGQTQTHQTSLGSKANPCHAGSSSSSTGNSTRTASVTPSGQHATSSRSRTSTQRSSSVHRSASGWHGSSRTAYHPTRVASHGFGGGGGRGFGGGFGGFRGGGRRSDIRLKEDIVPLGRLDNGIGLYRFRYKGNDRTVYVGVMAQQVREIVPSAVARGRDGYLRVDYDKLGLEFMTWDAWTARTGAKTKMAP
jgi:hypothetical protein